MALKNHAKTGKNVSLSVTNNPSRVKDQDNGRFNLPQTGPERRNTHFKKGKLFFFFFY